MVLFSAPVPFPARNADLWALPRGDKHIAHEMMMEATKAKDNPCLAALPSLIEAMCEQNLPPPDAVAELLFYRTVFDPAPDEAGKFSRENEVDCLCTLVLHRGEQLRLMSMIDVLRAYGALFWAENARTGALVIVDTGSLDNQVSDGKGEASVGLETALRNVGYAFDVWTAQVDSDVCLRSLLGETKSPAHGFSETAAYSLAIVQLCVQILLSPFWARLKIAVAGG